MVLLLRESEEVRLRLQSRVCTRAIIFYRVIVQIDRFFFFFSKFHSIPCLVFSKSVFKCQKKRKIASTFQTSKLRSELRFWRFAFRLRKKKTIYGERRVSIRASINRKVKLSDIFNIFTLVKLKLFFSNRYIRPFFFRVRSDGGISRVINYRTNYFSRPGQLAVIDYSV